LPLVEKRHSPPGLAFPLESEGVALKTVLLRAKLSGSTIHNFLNQPLESDPAMGTKKSGKGRRKLGRKKRRNRSKIRHRKG
jgi:hypothetical protein